jgi:hypothetical protein
MSRFYIVDTDDGSVSKTDNVDLAKDYAKADNNVVIDTEKGEELDEDGDGFSIDEAE